MSEAVDYFSNHALKMRFPWSLYHGPVVRALADAVERSPGADRLKVGSGPFFELGELPQGKRRFTVCDIDAPAIEVARKLHGDDLARADVIDPSAPLPYGGGAFDLVVSMDVIEHVPDPHAWLREVLRVLRPGGALFLTTPNYASWSLRIIENTVLEGIARVQGFSRRHLHPTKMNAAKVRELFESEGLLEVRVRSIAFGWVLAVDARKPA